MSDVFEDVLGVIQAGGQSTRFGSPKALAEVGGKRVVDRVRDALASVTDDVVLIANDADLARSIALPWRPDTRPGLAALGGILTGLTWAATRGCRGILSLACDMPFVEPKLLRRILQTALDGGTDVVAPESSGPRGIEPLCAFYGTGCIDAIERALARDDKRMISFHDDVTVARVPMNDVRTFGDPEILFLNINTAADRARAEDIAQERANK
jgi:molybdopterin-guanine dinucleotide biosynthesis protein A